MMQRVTLLALAVLLALLSPALAQLPPAQQATVSARLNRTAVTPGGEAVIAVIVDVAEDYHAQSATPSKPEYIPFVITPAEAEHVTFGPVQYPPGQLKTYPALGELNVYDGRVISYVPVKVAADAPPGELKLTGRVRFQICDDTTCFLPQNRPFEVVTRIVADPAEAAMQDDEAFAGYGAGGAGLPPGDAADGGPVPAVKPVAVGMQFTVFTAFAAALLAGILFNVMPCVLPVVPLKAVGFYEVSQHDRRKSVLLGLIFSLGLVSVFAVLGLLIFVFKSLEWGELFTLHWFRIGIVAVLLAMAVGTFGLFTPRLPTALYRFSPRHDTYLGNFLFGGFTALLSTPCTFGLFVLLLTWAATQPQGIGVALLITVGIGMALPYLVLSALPEVARRLPRTGPWAELVKQLMAFLLLAAAVYFAKPYIELLVSSDAFWWTMFAVVAAAGLFLVVRTVGFTRSPVGRAVAVVIAFLMIAPALWGARKLTYHPYDWRPFTPEALAEARASGRLVLVEFTADWCGNCHWLEATVLNHRDVVRLLNERGTVMLKADVTADTAPALPLLSELTNGVGGIPLTALYPPGGGPPVLLTGVYSTSELRGAVERLRGEWEELPVASGP